VAYATQAIIAGVLAHRLYPVRYEAGRLMRVVAAGIAAALAAGTIPEMHPLAGFLVRGTATVAVYAAVLWVTGFFRPTERAFLRELAARAGAAR
jgi:hypothetical protein